MRTSFLLHAAAVLVLSAGFISCSSDDDNNSVIGGDNVVKNDAEAVALVNGAYGPLQKLSSSFSFVIETNTDRVISFEGEEDEAGPLNSRFEQSSDTWYQVKIFNNLYLSIANDNDAIKNISASTTVSQATKNATIGKAKLLRGLSYLYLVQLYGEVPIVTEDNPNNKTRNSIDEVFTQIVQDLTDAESLLPDYDASPINPSKGAAQALLSRTYLVWGDKPLSSTEVAAIANSQTDPAFRKDDAKLQKAVEYADKVINGGHYSLLSDYTKLFGRNNESKAPEHIFTIRHDGDASDAQGNHQTHCGWTFPFQNGQNGQAFTENHLEVADINVYSDWLAAEPEDVVRRNQTYTISLTNPIDGQTYTYYSPIYTPILGKAVDQSYDNSINEEIKFNSVDRIEIRYAEVLLIKAEALVQLGKTTEAAVPFNQIRERAFGNSNHNLTSVSFDDIKKEWGYEFGYEQKHLLNLYRWKELIKTVRSVSNFEHFDDSYATAGATGRDGSTVSSFFAKIHKHLVAKYNNVKGKFYRQPIPTGLSGEDLGITPQNPGF
ncbi:MAG: RagB/SusD family nutrient uptake outer membrane protein [Prevotella sp.]|nr:RagB/SusD family nutrient uptake outer membrane protein [Prevotella sp.]